MKKLEEERAQEEKDNQRKLDEQKTKKQMEEEISTGVPLLPTNVLKSSSSASSASTPTTTNTERAIVPCYVPDAQRPRLSMVETLLQRLIQVPSARVAPRSPEEIEEILRDTPPQAQEKIEDIKVVEETKQASEDQARPSIIDWGKGPINLENLVIPNDPNLQVAMKEMEINCNDFARHIVQQTTIMMQEAQLTQIRLFQKLQLNYTDQAQQMNTCHQQSIKEAKEALATMTEQITELQDMEKIAMEEKENAIQNGIDVTLSCSLTIQRLFLSQVRT